MISKGVNMEYKYKFFAYLPQEAKDIRTEVFVNEQKFENEFDDIDDIAYHLIIWNGAKAIANARLYRDDKQENSYIIGRLAVLKSYRNCHIGSELMRLLEEKVKTLSGKKISLSAQCRAKAFYEKLGYKASGEIYLDEYCPHIHMEKLINDK